MKRTSFFQRLAGAALIPLAAPLLQSDGPVAEEAGAGIWLRFIKSDGTFWGGMFKANLTTSERLRDLQGVVQTVLYESNGVATRTYPLEAVIQEYARHGL